MNGDGPTHDVGSWGGTTWGGTTWDGPPPPVVVTEFASVGARAGIDPGRSTGTARGVAILLSVGSRQGIDPGRSTGQGS